VGLIARRRFIECVVLALVAAPLAAAESQQAGKVPRIGYLSLTTVDIDNTRVAAFRQGLRELGYVEDQNVVIVRRHAAGRLDRMAELAAELVGLKVDVLVTFGGAHAAKQASSTVPIVMIADPDPVGTGLVASLARPGGQVTGLSDAHGELAPKRLQLLKEAVPSASRVAVLLNPANPITGPQLKALQAAAPALGLTLLPLETGGREDIERAFLTMRKDRPDGVLVIADPTLGGANRRRIAELAIKNRLPAISTIRPWAEDGILIAYGTSFADLWRRAATYVDKILKGVKPGDLPVEQPTTFELVINLKTAKALGLTIPPALLARADQLIQ
jgi:putative ABC transport system substrate-binding protein